MLRILAFTLLIPASVSPALADDRTKLNEAQLWAREASSRSLSEDEVARTTGSYRKSAIQLFATYASRYHELVKLDPHELSDEQLTAGWEIFVTMAAAGTYVARKSTDYPACCR